MATIGQIDIGMAVNNGPLDSGLKSSAQSVRSFAAKVDGNAKVLDRAGKSAAGFGSSLFSLKGLIIGALGGAAAASIKGMAANFAHLQEASNKVDAVFGGQAESVKASAKAMADAYGMSVTEIYDKQSMMGAMLTGVGFNNEAAVNYSDVFTRLANDMTRRWDVEGGMNVAMDQLMAGLRGSGDALEKYGVTMNEETVKARAYQMGLAKVGQELSEGAKKQARASIILEQMKSSIGAAADEAGSFGANAEALSGRFENLTTTLGEVFAPTLGSIMGGMGDLLKWMENLWVANKDAIFDWAGGLAESLGFSVDGVDILSSAVGFLGKSWDSVGLAFKFVQSNITDGLGYIMTGLSKLADSFDWLVEKMGGTSSGLGDFLATYADELHDLSATQYEAFQQAFVGPDSGKLMQESLAKTREGITAMQKELAAKPMELMKDTGAKGTANKLYKEGKPYGSAVLAGSAEATKAIAKARLGTGTNSVEKTSKATADNTKKSVVVQTKMANALDSFLDKYKVATTVSM